MHLTYRKTCRVCGCAALPRVIDLGEQYLQGSFVKPGMESPPKRKIACSLVRCDPTQDERACGLLQLSLTVPPAILYSSYWYRSGTNNTMRQHLAGIANEAASLVRKAKARVLDIGCNDGTLLGSYPANYVKFGVDPSDACQDIPVRARIVRDLFPSAELKKVTKGKPFDIITSIAMFYDLESPVDFVNKIKENLAPDGLWVFEMSYMPAMLAMNSYDTICHEHLEYYSLSVVECILKKAGMKLIKVGLNDINGGSIRCYATHADTFRFKNDADHQEIKRLRHQEFDLQLDTDKPYKDFQDKINAHRDELSSLIRKLRREGKRIHVYGASTKGNTILQFCGLDNSIIECAADRNPDKDGARTLGTDIPIVSEAESRRMRPDYYLVLPWHFKMEFIEREEEALNSGVGMIFPLPTVEVIKRPLSHRKAS